MRSERRSPGELIEQVLPILNAMVLVLPLVLVGIELVGAAAQEVTLPDLRPDVAELETPPAPRRGRTPLERAAGAEPELPASAEAADDREPGVPSPPPRTFVFPDPMLGYGG